MGPVGEAVGKSVRLRWWLLLLAAVRERGSVKEGRWVGDRGIGYVCTCEMIRCGRRA